MIIINRIYQTVRYCALLTRLKWANSKSLFFLDIVIGLFRESKVVLNMVFPAVILQFIINKTAMDHILVVIMMLSLIMTALSIGIEIIQRSLSNYSLRALNYLIVGLNRNAMQISLEAFEKSSSMSQFDKAYDGLWKTADIDYRIFSVILSKLVSFAITAYIFSTIHWSVAIIVSFTLFFEFYLSGHLSVKTHKKDAEKSQLSHKIKYVLDVFFDYKTNKDIFINKAKGFFINKYLLFTNDSIAIEREKRQQIFKYDMVFSLIELIRTFGIYIVAVYKYIGGSLPIASFTLFTNAAKQMTYAVWQVLQSFEHLFQASAYIDDYLSYMNLETTKFESNNSIKKDQFHVIEFKNVSFRYPNQDDYAIKNVSFVISKGETVALVGDNGAGKSTIIKLLLRLYHTSEGEILLNGKSIYSYCEEEYSAIFAPVFQDYMLYSLTICENILFSKSMYSDTIFSIIEQVGLSERIMSLPKGIDTPYTKRFNEDGVDFSGGEEQKLAIARAFSKNSEILVLDEPTAALDPLAESNMYKMVFEFRDMSTKVFVSHRMSTTRFCNKILVFDNGSLVEEGSHSELMEKNGIYRKMFTMQTYFYKDRGEIS